MSAGMKVKDILGLAVAVGMGASALLSLPALAESTSESGGKLAAKARAPLRFSAAQLSEVHQRMALAKRIIDALAPQAKQMDLADGWKQSTMDILLANPSGTLAQIARLGGYQATIEAATTGKGLVTPKVFGDITQDLTYKPFNPCRYIDTRNVGGKINGIRGFDLSNTGAAYGGVAGCAPLTLAGVGENQFGALAMNITIVDTSSGAPGFLTARPAGSTNTTSTLNWFQAGSGVQVANAAIITMDQSANPNEFEFLTSGPVNAIADLFGAFIAPEATALECTTTFVQNTAVAPGSFNVFGAACPVGFTKTGGGCRTPSFNVATWAIPAGVFALSAGGALNHSCSGNNITAGNITVEATGVCCRVPGR